MAAIRLNEAEQEAIQGLTWQGHIFAVLMYVLEFRRRMNFATFTVGETPESEVSEKFLADCVECRPKAGSHYKKKTHDRHFVQRQIKVLVDAGLLERLPKQKRLEAMRFFFPLAAVEKNRFQEVSTMRVLRGEHVNEKQSITSEPLEILEGERCAVVDNSVGEHYPKTGGSALILGLLDKNKNKNKNKNGADSLEFDVGSSFSDLDFVNQDDDRQRLPISREWVVPDEVAEILAKKFKLPVGFVRAYGMDFRFSSIESGIASRKWNAVFIDYFNRGLLTNNSHFYAALWSYRDRHQDEFDHVEGDLSNAQSILQIDRNPVE